MKQKKYIEAARVINVLLQNPEGATKEQIFERAKLLCFFAQVRYYNFLKKKDSNRDAAESDLNQAESYAIKDSFRRLDHLLTAGFINEQDPALLECISLIVAIFEHRGYTLKALTWRRRWLGGQLTYPDMAYPESVPSRAESQAEEVARKWTLEQSKTPGWTPLINSIIYNYPEAFQEMLDAGVDVEERCERGLTPMMHAAMCQHPENCGCETAIRKLKDRDADIRATAGTYPETALHHAVRGQNSKIIQVFLELGADIDASAPNTPLAGAVKRNQASVAKQLLDCRANVKIVDGDDWTLLHHAVSSFSYDVLVLILQRNCRNFLSLDLEARSFQGMTALMLVAQNYSDSRHYALAKALIEHGAKVNSVDGVGRCALFFAIDRPRTAERERFARLLLDNSADVDILLKKNPRRVREYPVLQDYIAAGQRGNSSVVSGPSTGRRNSVMTTRSGDTVAPTETKRSKKSMVRMYSRSR